MAHFIEFANDDATTSYVNLDLMAEVNMDDQEVTFSDGRTYKGFDEAEWRQIMKFVDINKI